MRYVIYRPHSTIDLRRVSFASLEDLRTTYPVHCECDTERQAVDAVRELYPDAIGMPVPIEFGSGEARVLGVLAGPGKIDLDASIPFVLFVHAVAESNLDKMAIKRNTHWNGSAWKPPVLAPKGAAQLVHAEIRASDLNIPTRVVAHAYRRADRLGKTLVIYAEVNGIEMSIELLDELREDIAHR